MKIDFDKYDQITDMEKQLEKLIKITKLSEYETYPLNSDNKLIFALTILTILYKEKIYNIHLIKKLKKTNPITIKKLEHYAIGIQQIFLDLKECLQEYDLYESLETIKDYGDEIQIILTKYFKRKNYILEKMPIEIITQEKNLKELLKMNPFIINQCIKHKNLTKEEKIIADILEYYNTLVTSDDYINNIKSIIMKNNDEKNIKKIIMFIISDIYQEIKEDMQEENKTIQGLIEDETIQNEEIINLFINNNKFSKECLEYFLIYNMNIKKGRLEELKNKPSYNYIKRRCKK